MDRLQSPPAAPPNFLLRPGIMEVLVCATTALAYVATLSFGFVYDDVPQILKNPAIHEWRFVPQYFTSHVWSAIYPNTTGNYYRPLFLLWLRLNYALFGTQALGWHLTSIACHVLATWLVFRIAQRLSADRSTAFLAALIFGLHPTHIENVAWISGVSDPLMACFLLGSFLAFLRARDPEPIRGERAYALLSLILFAAALLAKETAIVFPLLIFGFVLIFQRNDPGGRANSREGDVPARDARIENDARHPIVAAIRQSLPYWLLALIYSIARFRALGAWSHPTIPIPWSEVVLTWPAVLWFYASHLIFPLRLSEFYPLDYVPHFTAAAVLIPLAWLVLIAIAIALILFFMREQRAKNAARFALVLLVVPLLPVLALRSLTPGDIVHDRYLYLPCAGFALLIALVIRELGRRLPQPRCAFIPTALAALILATCTALTVTQQMQWASDILLYTRGVKSAPANLTVRDNLASALLNANQPARAIPLYLEVLNRDPGFWRSNYNLGFAYYKTGNFAAAENYLQRAIRINPDDSDQYIYLAFAQLELKKLPEAAENASRALARSPNTRGYHFVLGLIFEAEDDRARAAAEFRTEVAAHPENAAAAAELQKLNGVSSAPEP